MPALPILLQALWAAIAGALVSIGAKVLSQRVTERLVAAVVFWGLSVLTRKTDNILDNELYLEAYRAYYGKDPEKLPVSAPAEAQPAPTAPIEPIQGVLVLSEADQGLPEAPMGEGQAPSGGRQGVSQEADEVAALRS